MARAAGVSREYPLEVAEVFGGSIFQKVRGPAPRLRLLVLVIQAGGHRVMRVVNFEQEIRHGELQLLRPQPPAFIFRRKAVTRGEKLKNVGVWADDQPPGLEVRRRERWPFDVAAVQKTHERRHSGAPCRLTR